MIKVNVNAILGIIPLLGGNRIQVVEIEDESNVSDLLEKLIQIYGEELRDKILDGNKKIKNGIVMFVNGVSILALGGLNEKLKSGDEFLIFPPVGGG